MLQPELKSKIFNILLLLFSLIGYLEWGKDNSSFLFQAEREIVSKVFTDPASVIHPLTVLPLAGQIVLLLTLLQKRPSKRLTYIGMAGIGLLLALMFVIGIIDLNYKILLSTLPFLITGFFTIRHHRKKRTNDDR